MRIRKSSQVLILLASIFFCSFSNVFSQKSIQLERVNTLKRFKYYTGQQIEFSVKEYPDTWRSEEIYDILYEEKTFLVPNDIIQLDQIVKIRRYQPWARGIGENLYRFSAAWYLYAGIAQLAFDFEPAGDTMKVGVGTLALGFVIDKLFYQKTIKLGKNWRLRILDVSF